MDDVFGKILASVAGVLLLLFLPILCITLKAENTSQALIDNAVVEFVDNARATAQITPEAYEELDRTISAVQSGFTVRL